MGDLATQKLFVFCCMFDSTSWKAKKMYFVSYCLFVSENRSRPKEHNQLFYVNPLVINTKTIERWSFGYFDCSIGTNKARIWSFIYFHSLEPFQKTFQRTIKVTNPIWNPLPLEMFGWIVPLEIIHSQCIVPPTQYLSEHSRSSLSKGKSRASFYRQSDYIFLIDLESRWSWVLSVSEPKKSWKGNGYRSFLRRCSPHAN